MKVCCCSMAGTEYCVNYCSKGREGGVPQVCEHAESDYIINLGLWCCKVCGLIMLNKQ